MKKVVVLNRVLKHYRVPFYLLVKEYLSQSNIDLRVIHGRGGIEEKLGKDAGFLDWAIEIENINLPFGFYWQPCWQYLKGADLIVVEQASKALINYPLMVKRLFLKQKLAFVGHGLTRVKRSNNISNIFKTIILRNVDWWFAYTEGVKEFIASQGFLREKITNFQNSIDVKRLIEIKNSITEDEINEYKKRIKLGNGPVGIFCGKIYPARRIEFLLNACMKIKADIPNFEMIFLGGGVDQNLVSEEVKKNNWIHYFGPCFDREKVIYFILADVFLMPGSIGLAVLDSFALETPIITTAFSDHGPEVEYIQDGINGVIVADDFNLYVDTVKDILSNKDKLDRLKSGCRNFANKYNIREMAIRFKKGIVDCLQ